MMNEWNSVRRFGVPVLTCWEVLVKPGIRRLAIDRTKEVNRERRSYLYLLMMRQSYLTRKVHEGHPESLVNLREVQIEIEEWFKTEVEKVKHQSRVEDIQTSEKVRIHHHKLHQNHIKRTSILKLMTTEGLLEGHQTCFDFLQERASDLLQHPAVFDLAAQEVLLAEVDKVFTDKDNQMLIAEPSKKK